MCRIYVINVGSNTSHSSTARSPIFPDGSFVYVPFPTDEPRDGPGYAEDAVPFTRGVDRRATHADPDWDNLTYGDCCANPRAGALNRVRRGDVLVFWALLWESIARDWSGFTGNHSWYLIGAIRVQEFVEGGQSITHLSEENRARARANAHLAGNEWLRDGDRVFLGDLESSARFKHAVELSPERSDGLMYKAFTTAARAALSPNGRPRWSSSLRTCRQMWDLNRPDDRARAELVSTAISQRNEYELLRAV